MEIVKQVGDINLLKDNRIEGKLNLKNSTISFKGINNVLFVESDVEIVNSTISFEGDNSIIYLSSSKYNYPLLLVVHNDSTIYFGKDNVIYSPFNLGIQESQNLIIGDDCIISSGVNIRTSDAHPIFNGISKERINFSHSVFIGDHVFLGHLSYISRGVHIGSGAVISNASFLSPLSEIPSNSYILGNPAKILDEDVFFTKDYVGSYKNDESLALGVYKSNVFIFEYVEKETLSLRKIDNLLKILTVDERLEFIIKLFVKNKRKNRFFI